MVADTATGVPTHRKIAAIDDTDDDHNKEIEFNRKKLRVGKIEAALAGHLLPSEMTEEICEAALEHAESVSKTQHRRITDHNRQARYVHKTPINVLGKTVAFVGCGPYLLRHGLVTAEAIPDADIIVVKDPANVPTELMIVAGLNGSMLVTPEFVASGGASGAALGFRRAVKVKRAVHLTGEFIEQNEILAAHIMSIASQADSCWTVVSCEDLIDLAARRKAREVLAFMTITELDDYPFIQTPVHTTYSHCP